MNLTYWTTCDVCRDYYPTQCVPVDLEDVTAGYCPACRREMDRAIVALPINVFVAAVYRLASAMRRAILRDLDRIKALLNHRKDQS